MVDEYCPAARSNQPLNRDAPSVRSQLVTTLAVAIAGQFQLAVSQPAKTIAVTPYLVKDPAKVAAKLARPLRTPEGELLKQLTRRDTGFAYLAHRAPGDPRPPRRAHEDRGARVHPRAPSHLPARLPRLAAARQRRQ